MGSFQLTVTSHRTKPKHFTPCPPLSSLASCCQTWRPPPWPLWQSASDKSIQQIHLNVSTLPADCLTLWAPAGAWRGVAYPYCCPRSFCPTKTTNFFEDIISNSIDMVLGGG